MTQHSAGFVLCVALVAVLQGAQSAVLPRPPSTQGKSATTTPGHRYRGSSLIIITSSELPKQIPPPTQSLTNSATPQYHEVVAIPQLKLLWVTTEMDTDKTVNRQAASIVAPPTAETNSHKHVAKQTHLLPNTI